MSNWPKGTTKGDKMTNEELAKKLENWCEAESQVFAEAANRLRSLPDPAPEPVKDLRWLIGRHECLSRELEYHGDISDDEYYQRFPLNWADDENRRDADNITEVKALKVVRAIVKGLCDEHGGAWNPKSAGNTTGPWYHFWIDETHYHPTELEAIDELLTVMEGTE